MAQQKKAATKRTETVASPAGEARKQALIQKNEQWHREKVRFGGLGSNERRFLEKEGFNLELEFCMDVDDSERQATARRLRESIVAIKKRKKRFLADQQQIAPVVEVPNGLDEFSDHMVSADS